MSSLASNEFTGQSCMTFTSDQEKQLNSLEEKPVVRDQRLPYIQLLSSLKDGTSPIPTPPLLIVQKKLAQGPRREPVLVLEATSPRHKGGLPQLIRAVPFAQRANKGHANTQGTEKPKLRSKPLKEATLASVPQECYRETIQQWLANMDLPAHTEYAALVVAGAAEFEAMSIYSGSDFSDCSTAGGDGGTFANAFGLRIIARRVCRKPLRFVRAAAAPLFRAFKAHTVLDATEWPVSHALTDIEEW